MSISESKDPLVLKLGPEVSNTLAWSMFQSCQSETTKLAGDTSFVMGLKLLLLFCENRMITLYH